MYRKAKYFEIFQKKTQAKNFPILYLQKTEKCAIISTLYTFISRMAKPGETHENDPIGALIANLPDLKRTVAPKDTPEWRGYESVCRKLAMTPPDPRYPYSLHVEYARCKPFSEADYEQLAQCRAPVATVQSYLRCYPGLSGGEIRYLYEAEVKPRQLEKVTRCTREFPSNWVSMGVRQIALLANTQESTLREYLAWYTTAPNAKMSLAFDTVAELCNSNIPLEFSLLCREKTPSNTALYSDTIISLYSLGGNAPTRYGLVASWNTPIAWGQTDKLLIIKKNPNKTELEYLRSLAENHDLGLSARSCIRLADAHPNPSIDTIRQYRTFLGDTATESDIVDCTIARIPTEKIAEYRTWEKKIVSRYSPDNWSVSHIVNLYRAGISPEQSCRIWERFSGDGQWGKFDCKREVFAELLAMPGFVALTEFLSTHPDRLQIGKQVFTLRPSDSNIGFFRGILKTVEQNGRGVPKSPIEWQAVIRQYEGNANEFIRDGESQEFGQIFFMSARGSEDAEWAFISAPGFRNTLESRYGSDKVHDYSQWEKYANQGPNRTERFIADVEAYARANPNKPILIHIGFHGGQNGGTWPFWTEHMARLARIANRPNVVLDIMSCYGWDKMDANTQNLANVRLSSQFHAGKTSYGELMEAFETIRPISHDRLRALTVIYGSESITLLNQIRFSNDRPLLYTGSESSNIPPTVNYNERDIAEILKIQTPNGKTVGQILGSADLLRELVAGTTNMSPADFNGTGKVSYAEAILYRTVHHRSNLTPTVFASRDGKYKNI